MSSLPHCPRPQHGETQRQRPEENSCTYTFSSQVASAAFLSPRSLSLLLLLLREESHEQRRMSRGFGERVRRTKECKKRRLAVGMRVFIISSRITVTHFFNLWMYYYHFCLSSLFVRKQIAVVRALPAPPRRRCKCMCTLIQCILMHSPWALESCASQKLFSRCEQRTQFSAYNFGLRLRWFMSNMLCEQCAFSQCG
jgi:hypothetical protein